MKNIKWGWIVLGGFLAELLVFVIIIPLTFVAGRGSMLYSAPPASFIATFILGFWVARKSPERRVLHGFLVGVVAILIYIAMSRAQPEPTAYIVAHLLKALGGIAGGFLAARRSVSTGQR
jgi:putative membrane protein (TIGR04086 family)